MYMVAVTNTTLLGQESNTTSVEVFDIEVASGGTPVLPILFKVSIAGAEAEGKDRFGPADCPELNMPDCLRPEPMTVLHWASTRIFSTEFAGREIGAL